MDGLIVLGIVIGVGWWLCKSDKRAVSRAAMPADSSVAEDGELPPSAGSVRPG